MPHSVLVINEDRLAAKNIAGQLRKYGLQIKTASDVYMASNLMKHSRFDAVVCTIHGHEISGSTALQALFSKDRSFPILFTTSSSEEKHSEVVTKEGRLEIFAIPFEINTMISRLGSILNTRLDFKNEAVIAGGKPPSQIKRFFYNALASQWNPESEIDWNANVGFDESLSAPMAHILSPIVMGEYSAFNGIPRRILMFDNYEVKQYLSVQLVDETRHAEAFDLYLTRINAKQAYEKAWRNIHFIRYFNEMKKLTSDDDWLAGLLVTEVIAHTMLDTYIVHVSCKLSRQLFSRILYDEARHISFVNYYLREVLRGASSQDKDFVVRITERIVQLTKPMIEYYRSSLEAFGIPGEEMASRIESSVHKHIHRSLLSSVQEDPPTPSRESAYPEQATG